MKMLVRAALALLALLVSAPALADHATYSSSSPLGYAPEYACVTWSGASIGSGSLIPCGTGSGGGGGGSNAAAASTGATAGAFASQTGYVGSDGKVYNQVGDLLGHPLISIFGTVAATQSGTWNITNITGTISLPTGAATSALQTTGIGYLSTLSGTVSTVGSTAPTTGQQITGKNPAGNSQSLSTDTLGRLLPGQGIAYAGDGSSTPGPVTLTASAATQLAAAVSNRVGFRVQVEQALTAAIYLCSRVTTTCSATSHDGYIPASATDGSIWNYDFPPNSAIYYFTTGTPKVLPVNVVAQ